MKDKVKVINMGVEVEATPGKTVVEMPSSKLSSVGVCKFISLGDNLFKAQVVRCPSWVRLTEMAPAQLGLGIEYNSLKRLIIAGFVLGQKVTPRNWQFSLESYYEHVERVHNDPEFWDPDNPARNYQKYQAAL